MQNLKVWDVRGAVLVGRGFRDFSRCVAVTGGDSTRAIAAAKRLLNAEYGKPMQLGAVGATEVARPVFVSI